MSRLHRGIRVLCLSVLAFTAVVCIGIAYGRYRSTVQNTLGFEAASADPARSISIRSDNGWLQTNSAVSLLFFLDNGGAADQKAYLRLTATEAFPADAAVTLTIGEIVYTAVPQVVEEGDPLYSKIGRGTEFRFYAAEGHEMTFAVSDTQRMTLSVAGASETALLRLTATEA